MGTKRKEIIKREKQIRSMPVSISKRNEDEKEKMVVEGYAVRFNNLFVL